MNTKINLTYKGVPYVLEYDRMSVKLLEANGFNIEEFMAKPMSNIELAFAGAFIKNHRKHTCMETICNNKLSISKTTQPRFYRRTNTFFCLLSLCKRFPTYRKRFDHLLFCNMIHQFCNRSRFI